LRSQQSKALHVWRINPSCTLMILITRFTKSYIMKKLRLWLWFVGGLNVEGVIISFTPGNGLFRMCVI